jgi:hypothetical protein
MWGPAPPLYDESPLAGSPEGVRLRLGSPIGLRLELGGGPLPPGRYRVHFKFEAGGAARLTLAGVTADAGGPEPAAFDFEVNHPGGPLKVSGSVAGADSASFWIGDAKIEAEP